MKRQALLAALFALGLTCRCAAAAEPGTQPAADQPIRLLVRADDLGNAQATNEACVRAFREGIVRSVEVIVPGQWTPDAVRLVAAAPGLDVGVHLALTSEWDRSKWRPLTTAPSLVDQFGYLVARNRQPKDSPLHVGVIDSRYDLREAEAELRAQIDSLQKQLTAAGAPTGTFSHFSAHMYVCYGAPDLMALTERLGKAYGVRATEKGLRHISDKKFLASRAPQALAKTLLPATQEEGFVEILEQLTPGDWLWVVHPAFDTPELRAFDTDHDTHIIAERRAADFRCVTSEKVQEVIRRRGIQLISYKDLAKED